MTEPGGAANLPRPVPRSHDPAAARLGLFAGLGCFAFWGLVAVYWKWLHAIEPLELVAHRTVWSLGFLLAVLWRRGRLGEIGATLRSGRLLAINALSSGLLMGNWLVFLWAVEHGSLLEVSLGYFLVPLFHVTVGFLFLHERPRPAQWLAILVAAAGVGWLVVAAGRLPWIALLLVGTWGPYGFVRKRSPMGALDGLTVETLLVAPFAAGWLVWLAATGRGALGHSGAVDTVLLLCSGWITSVPLVWFGFAASRIPISTLGLLQYVSPSLQFLLGWLVYGEPLDAARLPGFLCIWAALVVYGAEGWVVGRRLERRVGG